MTEQLTLAPEAVEAIACRVAELIGGTTSTRLVDAAEIARRFNVSRDYIYSHAEELGAVRLGTGPKARLRFDPARVVEVISPQPFRPSTDRSTTPRRTTRPSAELLPIGGKRT